MKSKAPVEIGSQFGELAVMSCAGVVNGRVSWRCKCSCGVEKVISATQLRHKRAPKSCGCAWPKRLAERNRKHGFTTRGKIHPLWDAWHAIRQRCLNPNCKAYINYGARGITICDEWKDDAEAFIKWGLANGWEVGLEIDRIDNNGPYSPSNCRFVTMQVNRQNRRITRSMTAFGERKTLSDWVNDVRCVVDYDILHGRLRRGWSSELAITEPSTRQPATANR